MEMRKRTGALVVAGCLASSACITGFEHPLGPPEDGFIEPGLVGKWTCTAKFEDPAPGVVEIMDFDGKQYYIQSPGTAGSDPTHTRAFATRLEGVTFLSSRDLGADAKGEWTLMAYALLDSGHLEFRVVDPRPFEDVVGDAQGVRDRLAGLLEDPEVLVDALSCTREDEGEVRP